MECIEMSYELLEHTKRGNYYPHGSFSSSEEAHAHAKNIGLKSVQYIIQQLDIEASMPLSINFKKPLILVK